MRRWCVIVAALSVAAVTVSPRPAASVPATSPATAPAEWRHYAGGDARRFFNESEHLLNRDTARRLRVKWRYRTGAIITASPSVAVVDLPGEGPTQVAYVSSWDYAVYALRVADGSLVWRHPTDTHPGGTFPGAGSPEILEVDGRLRVHVATGETLYSLDAATGAEVWRFAAGTGCVDAEGNPPGLCAPEGKGPEVENNEVESTVVLADGVLAFGMDTDDDAVGKGGWYGVDVHDGRLRWFLDLQSGSVCRPGPDDDVRRYDGFHTAAQLGLPADFFATRPGCDAPREKTGCENVWSSGAWDAARHTMYVATSNCDLDDPASTLFGDPAMPLYDEAIIAVASDGTPQWRWRVREVDNNDRAYGAVPNLFTLQDPVLGPVDVVGVGNKDGTYTVLDRDGVNERNGVSWDDPSAVADLPYWRTQIVAGGNYGGVIATAAVDTARRRVLLTTAAGDGDDIFTPQQPTVHALDADTGAVVWENTDPPGLTFDSSYGPVSAVDGVMLAGSTMTANLRVYDTANGDLLWQKIIGDGLISAIASGPAVVDGTVLVGTGVGARHGDPFDLAQITSWIPSSLVALCVTGVPGCPVITPAAPTGVHASAGAADGSLAVSWSPPVDDGGSPVDAYTVRVSDGVAPEQVSAGSTALTVGALVPGRPYSVRVQARNALGWGDLSAPVTAVAAGPPPVCNGLTATAVGTPGNDLLTGTTAADVIVGLDGNDLIVGLDGDDTVCGGDGNDLVVGGSGADTLFGDAGPDWLFGGSGDDTVSGGGGNDLLVGDAGTDAAEGGPGFDLAFTAEHRTSIP